MFKMASKNKAKSKAKPVIAKPKPGFVKKIDDMKLWLVSKENESKFKAKVKKIYEILTNRSMRREWPNKEEEILSDISSALQGSTVHMVGLWGGFKEGPTGLADQFDIATLDRLAGIQKEIDKEMENFRDRRGALKIKILFCDMHHRIASGISEEKCEKYYQSLLPLAKERGLNLEKLSKYYIEEREGKKGKEGLLPEAIEWFKGKPDVTEWYHLLEKDEFIQEDIDKLCEDPEYMSELLPMAKKHSRLYRNGMSLESVAKAYIETEMLFLRLVRNKLTWDWRSCFFFSFSKPSVQGPLFGDYPALYYYATKRGKSDCPWFMYEGMEKDKAEPKQESISDFHTHMRIKQIKRSTLATVALFATIVGFFGVMYYPMKALDGFRLNFEGYRRWKNFSIKYKYLRRTPTYQEFRDNGFFETRHMIEFCDNRGVPRPEYIFLDRERTKELKQVRDIVDPKAKRRVELARKIMDRTPKYNWRFNDKIMRWLERAQEFEPKSIEIYMLMHRFYDATLDHYREEELIRANEIFIERMAKK